MSASERMISSFSWPPLGDCMSAVWPCLIVSLVRMPWDVEAVIGSASLEANTADLAAGEAWPLWLSGPPTPSASFTAEKQVPYFSLPFSGVPLLLMLPQNQNQVSCLSMVADSRPRVPGA